MTLRKGDLLLKGRAYVPEEFDALVEQIAEHEGYVLHEVLDDAWYGSELNAEGGYDTVVTVKLKVVR